MTHDDFDRDLRFGESDEHRVFWEEVSRHRFPGFLRMDAVTTLDEQLRGHDWLVSFGDAGAALVKRVQTKTRRAFRRCDVALEIMHAPKNHTAPPWDGWIQKSVQDYEYFAYGWPTKNEAFVIPWLELRLAWLKHQTVWRGRAEQSWAARKPGSNCGKRIHGVTCIRSDAHGQQPYWSWSLCVDADLLQRVCAEAFHVHLQTEAVE